MEVSKSDSTAAAPKTVNPIEIALERVSEAPQEPAVLHFLRKHERLIDAQIAQLGRLRWRDITIALIGLGVLTMATLLVWEARQSRGVVLEPFRVPADMQARGMDGVVVATHLMDQLQAMQESTDSIRAASTYANNWGNDIAVEIPNTGVTIGDLRKFLRARLGKQVRLSGEVVRQIDGSVALSIRAGSAPGTQFEGSEAEFETLVHQAAEAAYRHTQPYRYAIWLFNSGRHEEAQPLIRHLANNTNGEDRLWAINSLATRSRSLDQKFEMLERGLRLDRDFTPFLYNMSLNTEALGHESESIEYMKQFLDRRKLARKQLNPARYDYVLAIAEQSLARKSLDLPRACTLARKETELAPTPSTMWMGVLGLAACQSFARDVTGARQTLADAGLGSEEQMRVVLEQLSPDSEVESTIADALDDWETAYGIRGALMREPSTTANPAFIPDTLGSISAHSIAAARTGRFDEAREIVGRTPLDCAFCVRARGTIEALAGDRTASEKWLDAAQDLTGSHPAVHGARAEALLILKDWSAAIEQARIAARMAPRWADPKKIWGDALMGQGKFQAALAQYQLTEKLAPNWGALKIAIGHAYAANDDLRRARESWEKAAALPLSPTDRAAVDALLAEPEDATQARAMSH